ncbi:competence/damage-inducible protein A [Kordiimonas pumila]|uniref:Competence/damage-inducible protein A n=1 Tax=Kordiimonas pumila TaxID=2161677 RepID=A0ABV7D8Y0_9PROT|nr:competence/damage-inducible protein A [Kordiimonas pumila]
MTQTVSASLVVIGDEILSGRTQDTNTSYLAKWLNECGIQLSETRTVPDIEAEIVAAVNALRARYDYVFTTGGIGPTHDDITAESISAAFGVPCQRHPEAYARLLAYYGEKDFTEARQRMTRVPEGGVLIDNSVSIAPGFQIENVFVMAGVPKVMQAMLETIRPRLKAGRKVWSETLIVYAPESRIAPGLEAVLDGIDDISIGSYPFYSEKSVGAQIVIRSHDKAAIARAMTALKGFCVACNYKTEVQASA